MAQHDGRQHAATGAILTRRLADGEPAERKFFPFGIDLGLTSLIALSSGETVATPQFTQLASKRLRQLQCALLWTIC